jgi:FMN phosphatase YigB (HAD superfamily)
MKLASYDIWDTCLTRCFSEPKHLFFEVARRLHGGERFETPETAELARLRVVAEQMAREKVPGSECRFDEITEALQNLAGEEMGRRFMELELMVERESVRPIGPVLSQLKAAREEGAAIAFVSDMYLPTAFLRELLQAHGFFQPEDLLFVSGEHRANKSTGELFEIIRKTHGVIPSAWTHWGDKLHADARVPRRMGIKAIHYRESEFTPSEIRAAESCVPKVRYASLIKGGMRSARLSGDQPAVLTDVVVPWLCALAAQIVQRAQKMGLHRIYFLSRDGEVLMRIAKKIAPPGLECRYLYSSRRAWCFPAMLDDDPASRRWLETFAISPRGILGSLEFSPEEQATILEELKLTAAASDQRAAPQERVFVWDHLRATGRMARVLERAAIAREACLAYLGQEGLFDDDLWAICDVGWVLNCQAALTRLLRVGKPAAVARGIYFMVNRMRPSLEETGPFDAWLLDEALDPGDDSIPRLLTCLSGLIEEFCLSSADPSLKGYRLDEAGGKVQTIFGALHDDKATIDHANALREAVERLSEEWMDELSDPEFVDQLSHCSLAELLRFLRSPSRGEASVVAELRHASEATNAKENGGLLARPWQIGDALRVLGRRCRLLKPDAIREPLWTVGCDTLTTPLNRAIRKLILTPVRRQHYQ